MRQFEIPFNHDEAFLRLLERNKLLQKYIAHIFVAPFTEDCKITRHKEAKKPLSRGLYESQIHRLIKAGYNVAMTFNNLEIIDTSILDYYMSLNIDCYIVNNDINARYLKTHNKKVIASITKRNTLAKITTMDYSIYDYIVLDYEFNVNYSLFEKLPENNYILLVNTYCDYKCNFYDHWYKEIYKCPQTINGFKNTTRIFAEDLHLFDKYVSIYKLQGREYSTEEILKDLAYYIFNKNFSTSIDRFGYDIQKYYNRGKSN